MWGLVVKGLSEVFTSWMGAKKAKHQAEANFQMKLAEQEATWDIIALRQSQFSWKDEIITIIWFTPLIVAWWEPEKARAWVEFASALPVWYQFGMFGIIAASFGLRWFFKQQGFKLGGMNG